MPRETKEQKALRYISERRLNIDRVVANLVVATCRGSNGETYRLGHDPQANQWRCTCPNPTRAMCSHLIALQMVTTKRGEAA